MKTIRLLTALCLVALLASLATSPARAEEGPREIVTGYLEALKTRDFVKVLHYTGIDLPPEATTLITSMLDRHGFLTWAVKEFTIKEVRQDGGLATVIVEEHHFKTIPPELRARLAEGAPQLEKLIRWGDNVVTERFVLVRLDGRWQFDAGHSGVQAGSFNKLVTDSLSFYGRVSREGAPPQEPSPEEAQAALGQFLNQVGFGQLVQSISASSPVLPVLAAFLVPNFIRAKAQGQLTACKSNLKNIGTALEMYSTDYQGHYPPQLSLLAPTYLKQIPTCPAAGTSTYGAGYQVSTNPDHYTVVCTGRHHGPVRQGLNFPQYTSTQGLISQ